MCLNEVTKTYATPNELTGFGYKIFANKEDGLRAFYYFFKMPISTYKDNEWYVAETGYIDSNRGNGPTYNAGFHIYDTYEAAKSWLCLEIVPTGSLGLCIRKVEFRDILHEGTEFVDKVIVARHMRILPEETGVDKIGNYDRICSWLNKIKVTFTQG